MAGLAASGKSIALEAALPNGTDVFVALLTALPSDQAGTGLVEAAVTGYARLAHDAWLSASASDDVTRSNDGAITFAALTEDLPGVVGWAIYSLITGGNLLAFGETVDGSDNPITVNFVATNEPMFAAGELIVTLRG